MRKYTKIQTKVTKVRLAQVIEESTGLTTMEIESINFQGDYSERKVKAKMKELNYGNNIVQIGVPETTDIVYVMETKQFMELAKPMSVNDYEELTKNDKGDNE